MFVMAAFVEYQSDLKRCVWAGLELRFRSIINHQQSCLLHEDLQ